MAAPRPTVAFCFHHAERSGASLWLLDFLRHADLSAWKPLAVLPGPSPLREDLESAGIECAEVPVTQQALTKAGALAKLKLLGNRVAAVGAYRKLLRERKVALAYVNSSVQIAPMVAARAERIPFVVHVHEAWAFGRAAWMKRWMLRRHAAGAIFASQSGMAFFGGEPAGKRWVFSPNGVEVHGRDARATGRAPATREEVRRSLGLGESDYIALFVGTLQAVKGVQDLLECWPAFRHEFPSSTLLLAGNVSDDDRHPAIDAFLRDGLEGVRHLGFRADVPELMAAADVLVLPSYAEAMPLSVIEAMAIGTPVVARCVGDVEWLIGEGRGFPFRGDGAGPLLEALRQAKLGGRSTVEAARRFAFEHLDRSSQHAAIVSYLAETASISS